MFRPNSEELSLFHCGPHFGRRFFTTLPVGTVACRIRCGVEPGKFSKFPDFHLRAQTLLAAIEISALKFSPTLSLNIISDPPDNRLLKLGETCHAAYIVTGNTHDFVMTDYKGTKIVSPKELFELLNT